MSKGIIKGLNYKDMLGQAFLFDLIDRNVYFAIELRVFDFDDWQK